MLLRTKFGASFQVRYEGFVSFCPRKPSSLMNSAYSAANACQSSFGGLARFATSPSGVSDANSVASAGRAAMKRLRSQIAFAGRALSTSVRPLVMVFAHSGGWSGMCSSRIAPITLVYSPPPTELK